MDKPIAQAQREAKNKPFDLGPFIARLNELMEKHNESYREAGMSAGLDHQAIRRILSGQRPAMVNCILLADHYGVNPNEFLELAGWPTLKVFDVRGLETDRLPPEAVDVALALSRVPDPGVRKQLATAVITLLQKHFE
ncbi:helix-turn-helix domain-containing protein [Longilinea arvoryzae]|uniref:helix-turn-helix domain-containing protein n=1 Tax=Longilinea arvoryzae TaxID=360412 RepID=UPI0009464D22|nr:helix-turn-helix transcriptional regulator [Longilinea arvoryzae]